MDCAAASLRRSRSSTSSSRRGALISMTSGRIIGDGRRSTDLRLRPNLKPRASDATMRRLPRFFGRVDLVSIVELRELYSYDVKDEIELWYVATDSASMKYEGALISQRTTG